MAAPTNVRVEANSQSTATIRWTYSGSNQVSVWRSLTSGSGFSNITPAGITAGTTSYTDTGLTVGTRYFYKLSDDGGSTFSSEVNVTTHTCLPPAGSLDSFSLPRLDPTEDPNEMIYRTQSTVNNIAERIESALGERVLAPGECVACPANGALVLNCSGHCKEWLVVADEDINSISIQYCDEGDTNIEFIIPPNVTRRIGGWPAGFGFSGDEGFAAPITTGSEGSAMNVGASKTGGKAKASSSRRGTGTGIGAGGVGAGACGCVPTMGGGLTIKSCNADNSLNCQSTKSLRLLACGGRPPYTWSNTGSVNLSATSGPSTIVTPPTNSGSGEAGNAYKECHYVQQRVPDCNAARTTLFIDSSVYGCNDQLITDGGDSTSCAAAPSASLMKCVSALSGCDIPECAASGHSDHYKASAVDIRTAGMIAAGCNPCGVQAGATVTVTDSLGVQTTVVLRQ